MLLLFPIRDVRLGDGILLLENMSLETAIYGYQLITDEILEGFIHSLTHNVFKTDPRLSFQIWSSLAGILLIGLLGKYYWNRKNGFLSFFLVVSSGGFLLFYGYVENYSLTTAYLIVTTIFISHNVEKENKISPYILGILAALGASMHLVFGYTIFAFVYLTWILSENKKEFILNSFKSGIVACLLLSFIFGYFFFFSDLRIDLSMSHVTTHKFYPIKRWFSTQHFKEIVFCLLFTSLPSVFTFLSVFLFEREVLKDFLPTKLGKYLLFLLLGFFLHAFWHNPQLGFPADWDLMSFYWSILAIISIKLIERTSLNLSHLKLAFFFCFLWLQSTAFFLNKESSETQEKISQIQKNISEFREVYLKNPQNIEPKHRKFHLHTSYFFFRTLKELEKRQAPELLLNSGKILLTEFESRGGNYSKEWKKDFLLRSTRFHEEYLKFIE